MIEDEDPPPFEPDTQFPQCLLWCRRGVDQPVVIVTFRRPEDRALVSLEMDLEQWSSLPPVEYAVKLATAKKQPRLPKNAPCDPTAIPRAHIEWKRGENWVVLTASPRNSAEKLTTEIPLGTWFTMPAVQFEIEKTRERWFNFLAHEDELDGI